MNTQLSSISSSNTGSNQLSVDQSMISVSRTSSRRSSWSSNRDMFLGIDTEDDGLAPSISPSPFSLDYTTTLGTSASTNSSLLSSSPGASSITSTSSGNSVCSSVISSGFSSSGESCMSLGKNT